MVGCTYTYICWKKEMNTETWEWVINVEQLERNGIYLDNVLDRHFSTSVKPKNHS